MKKGLTELVMILDRSGSMRGLEEDTIGGFNSMIEKQKREDGEAYVSVVLFDDRTVKRMFLSYSLTTEPKCPMTVLISARLSR